MRCILGVYVSNNLKKIIFLTTVIFTSLLFIAWILFAIIGLDYLMIVHDLMFVALLILCASIASAIINR